VIADYTKDALVVVAGLEWAKVDDDALRWVWFNCANLLAETKHVMGIWDELELGGKIASIDDVQNTIGLGFDLNLTKVHGFSAQLNIIS